MARSAKVEKEENQNTLEERLLLVDVCPSIESHIKVNQAQCFICKDKECTKFCPTNVFVWSDISEELFVSYENCIECGVCKIGCPYEAIEYSNPNGGFGVFS